VTILFYNKSKTEQFINKKASTFVRKEKHHSHNLSWKEMWLTMVTVFTKIIVFFLSDQYLTKMPGYKHTREHMQLETEQSDLFENHFYIFKSSINNINLQRFPSSQ
jgi:hypothetical protein